MRYTKALSQSWCRRFLPLFRQLSHVGFGVGMTAGGTEMRWEAWWHPSGSGGAPPDMAYLQIWAKYLHVLQRYSSINLEDWLPHCPCADRQQKSHQYQLCSAACTLTPQEGGCTYLTIASPGCTTYSVPVQIGALGSLGGLRQHHWPQLQWSWMWGEREKRPLSL